MERHSGSLTINLDHFDYNTYKEVKMTCGIYKITENKTGCCYIGQSIDIKRRWRQHKKRFPLDLFSYEILMTCDADCLDFFERAFIDGYESHVNGFNIQKSRGGWYSRKGRIFSLEHRQKLSESNKHPKPPEHGATVSAAKKGKPWTDTQRELMRIAREKKKNAHRP